MVECNGDATRRRVLIALAALLGVGLVFRLIAWAAWPVVHDEITVVTYGLRKAGEVPGWERLAYEVPVTISNGITPLWWWLQAIPGAIFPLLSKAALRTLPLLFGLAAVALAFRAGRHAGGLRAGWLAGFLVATNGLVLYMNGRGEFTESLILPCVLALVVDLDPRGPGARIPWRAALWPALCLLVYLGKGLPIWFMYAGCLGLLWLLGRIGRAPAARLGLGRLTGLILLPLAPALAWLLLAQAVVFAPGKVVVAEIGQVDSIWHCVRVFTFGYGTAVKQFMVAGWQEAVFPFTFFAIWPGLAVLALPALITLGWLALRLVRAWRVRDPEGVARALVPLCLSVPFLVVVVAKGALGARFHLLYLAALLPSIAALIDAWVHALEKRRWATFLGGGALVWIYVAWTWSWTDRVAGDLDPERFALLASVGLIALGALVAAAFATSVRKHIGTAAVAAVCVFLGSVTPGNGPLNWGRHLAWEPGPTADLPHPVTQFTNPQFNLALYAVIRDRSGELQQRRVAPGDIAAEQQVEQDIVRRHRALLRDCMTADPNDRRAILFAAPALFRVVPEDRPFVIRVWQDYMRRRPEDREVGALFAPRRNR